MDGYRLACQAFPLSDCKLYVPPESLSTPQRTQVEGLEFIVELESLVCAYRVELPPTSLTDMRSDIRRLRNVLEQQHHICCNKADIDVLRGISPILRLRNWTAQVSVRDREIVALAPWPSRQLGLAFDLGTTKIACYLVDLQDGRTLASQGFMNPQISYGEDLIVRLTRASESPAEAARLQQLVVEAINKAVGELCEKVSVKSEQIVEAVGVGNTAMHHLFLRLPVAQLALAPYVPAVGDALDIKARDVGLKIAPGAYLHMLPNIAGFVGGDHVAMLLATGAWKSDGVELALDIGTNTEICLTVDGKPTSVSCASGPAFEGAHIKHGMRAADGALEHVRLVNDRVEFQTIGGAPPVGICGSGILDALAQLRLAGVLDRRGKIGDHARTRLIEGKKEFVLVSEAELEGRPAITITQHDVQELQLAKGAIRAGIQVLVNSKGLSEQDIQKVLIAGAFGTYIDVASAVVIGMLPPLPLERFKQVGNAAGAGARQALISSSLRAEAQTLAQHVDYIELATAPNFSQVFARAMYIE